MPNIFEPSDAIAPFSREESEFQVAVEPKSELTELTEPTESEEIRSFRWFGLLASIIFFVLAIRLINLQITQGQMFLGLAEGNRIEVRRISPPRGAIVDRQETVLVKNVPIYNLELYPGQLPREKVDREAIYHAINKVTGIPIAEIVDQVSQHGLQTLAPITLKGSIDRDTAMLWQTKLQSLAGVALNRIPTRSYELIPGLSHLLGYVGKVTEEELRERPDLHLASHIGKTGLEYSYDRGLQGQEGKDEIEVDSKGQVQRIVASEPAVPGRTLRLHLDSELQKVMAEALVEGIKQAGSTKGVVIALDPQNGGVLGMVSIPDYDNNVFVRSDLSNKRQPYFEDKDRPLFNRAIGGVYPPGSTVKPFIAVAGLEEKHITEQTSIVTPPEITIGQSRFPDWKPHGSADVRKAIAESNNIFFYALGGGYDKIKGLGPVKMKIYANKFGFGKPTNIDLPGEAKGLVPDPDWKKERRKESWYTGDSYHMAIGQGDLLVSPIQLAVAVSAIANNGKLYEPRVVQAIQSVGGEKIEQKQPTLINEQVADPNVLRIIREGMRRTVTDGTARPLNEIPMAIAGKTGTAQFEEKGKTHAWFTGFAPYDNPRITLVVMVERGGDSFATAVPIAKKIFNWYSEHNSRFTASETQ